MEKGALILPEMILFYYEENKLDKITGLISGGAKVDLDGKTAVDTFVRAAEKNYIEVVKLFIEAGILIDSEDKDHRTALSVACGKGHQELVTYLLSAGADAVHYYNGRYDQVAPIIEAAKNDQLEIARLLFSSAAYKKELLSLIHISEPRD